MHTHTVGVIGCGYWGPNLVRNCQAIPEARVKYVCDLDQSRLDYMSSLYQDVEATKDYRQIFNDPEVDSVFIATPVATHSKLGIESLEAGKNTFIEKPLSPSVRECNRLIEAADERFLVLMVGHTFVFSSPVREIKKIIDSGEIGEVMYVASRRLNLGLFQQDINVAWDLAPHDLSIVLYLLEKQPISINCQGKSHLVDGMEDITSITLNFENGCIALIQSSWIDPRKVREMTIVGTKKMIVFDDTEPLEKVRIYDKSVNVPPHYDTFAEFHYSYHYGDVRIPFIKQTEPLRVECQHFFDCIDKGIDSLSSGKKGREVVAILEAAGESLKNNGSAMPFLAKAEEN